MSKFAAVLGPVIGPMVMQAGTGLMTTALGSLFAPKAKSTQAPAAQAKPQLAPLPDREKVGQKAEMDAARRSAASGRKSTIFSDDDLLGA